MKHLWKLSGFLFILALLIVFWPGLPVDAQKAPPTVPHPLDGRDNCNICHATGVGGAPKFPADHTGRTNDMCKACHQPGPVKPATTAPAGTTPAAPGTKPAAGGIPIIPHPLQNRENCLACHQTGVGGATKVPASHAGRTIETCRGCHQPAGAAAGEVPQILPTPIPHPTAPAKSPDGCVTCHTSQAGKLNTPVGEWQSSIHSERGVGCADCHGGDPTKNLKEDAHAAKAGYTGIPKMVDIPALCASCHARVETMRQYDLPTDQWAKYQTSIHGIKLAQGDSKVATCYTCHDGHATKKPDDPNAKVYPLNVPGLCASCHSNTEYMKGYNIPTNQHSLYVQSVHGKALLNKQDLRAPSCATCHGTHGAAPPGFDEVANVCGSCHGATQDYYLKSVHASDQPGMPKCVTCHGRYDVMEPSDSMFVGTDTRSCGSCHAASSAQAKTVKDLYDNITASAKALEEAEAALKRATAASLIIAPEEAKIAELKTNLITARAAQHTLNTTVVKEKTDKAIAISKEIVADANKALDDSVFRRQVMGIGLVIMALAILSLYVIRRELYKQLPPE